MSQSDDADVIIKTSTSAAIAAVLIPIPVHDVLVITGVQVAMIIGIGAAYGEVINKKTAVGLIGVSAGAHAGLWFGSLIKSVPGLGTFFGMGLQSLIAGSMTYGIGIAFKDMCERHLPINEETMKAQKEKFEGVVEKKKEELKAKADATKIASQKIGFRAEPPKFSDHTIFYFDLSDYYKATIRVLGKEGKVIFSEEISRDRLSYTWRAENVEKGKLVAFLDIPDLNPIPIGIEYI